MRAIAIVKYVFTVIGIAMLVGAFFLYRNTSVFLEEAISANGTVVDLVESRSSDSTTYRPKVRFTTQNGKEVEFTSSTGSSPPSYSRGETVVVRYRASEPERARIDGFFSLWGGAIILGGMGGVFFLIGGGILLATSRAGRKDEDLKEHGTPVQTKFQSVELNEAYSVNGRHPFRVTTQWQNPSTSKVHVFQSRNLWFDPSEFVKDRPITVYIDSGNPKKYYVDLSFLPQLAE